MTGWLAISLGDTGGIGPEVTLKALAAELPADDTRYLIIGDEAPLHRLNTQLALRLTSNATPAPAPPAASSSRPRRKPPPILTPPIALPKPPPPAPPWPG